MVKRIGCFHAHHSNIEHIEKALHSCDVELIHFVDPGIERIKTDIDFTVEIAQKKIKNTLDWISQCHVDAILITCTFFTANIQDEGTVCSIPVIKIDDPLFHFICEKNQPQILTFTNPSTVDGTMEKLFTFARRQNKSIQIEPYLLENTFELIMQGKKTEYIERISDKLKQLLSEYPDKIISAAQLSMVPAAEKVELEVGLSQKS